jgi:hypothetical protein
MRSKSYTDKKFTEVVRYYLKNTPTVKGLSDKFNISVDIANRMLSRYFDKEEFNYIRTCDCGNPLNNKQKYWCSNDCRHMYRPPTPGKMSEKSKEAEPLVVHDYETLYDNSTTSLSKKYGLTIIEIGTILDRYFYKKENLRKLR